MNPKLSPILMRITERRVSNALLTTVLLQGAFLPGALISETVDCTSAGRNYPAQTVPECVDAQGFAASCTAAGSVRLWPQNGFHPASEIPLIRDSTDRVAGLTLPGRKSGHEAFSSLDVVTVGGLSRRLYVSYNAGLQVWDISSNPADPLRRATRDGWERTPNGSEATEFFYFPPVTEILNYIEDISAVNIDSTTDLVGAAGNEPVGPTFWEYRVASDELVQIYQDTITDARQVRLVKVSANSVYAFVGADDGLAVYNVSAARSYLGQTECLDQQGTVCPTVFRGFVGNTELEPRRYIDALRVPTSGKIFVSAASGYSSNLELWEVDDPQNPGTAVLRYSGLPSSFGSALFAYDNHYYLAVIQEETGINKERLKIFFIDSCVNGASCVPVQAVNNIALDAYPTANDYITYSEYNGTPYLFYGFATSNQFGPDIEKLLDLSALQPPNPLPLAGLPEITDSGGSYADPCNFATIRYWSQYYPRNYHGLNTMVPRIGQFSSNGYFYRAANSILDVHVLGEGSDPGAAYITTAVAAPQSEYWMSDVIAYQATVTGGCSPSPLSWTWSASSTAADVVPTQISEIADDASYSFDCVSAIGRCANASVSVEALNGSCLDAISTPSQIVVKDPTIDIVAIGTGENDTFQTCQTVPLAADLAGRAPAFWEWRINGVPLDGCSSSFLGTDLADATVACALPGSAVSTEDIFADSFESGATGAWTLAKSYALDAAVTAQGATAQRGFSSVSLQDLSLKANTIVTADLYVWDDPEKALAPRAIDDATFTITPIGTPAFSGAPSETVNGAAATLTYPAVETTTWSWELEDPFGNDTCSFPGKPSVACVTDTTDSAVDQNPDTFSHFWAQAGTYSYRVTVSNCGPDTDSVTDEVTVESGVQPDITVFNFKGGAPPSPMCCGSFLSGFKCQAGVAIDFQVDMVEEGSYAFSFDWERTSKLNSSYTSATPTGKDPAQPRWYFSYTFSGPSSPGVYPIARASAGLVDTQDFIATSLYPIEIVSGTPSCN